MSLISKVVLAVLLVGMGAAPTSADTEFRGIWVDAFHPGIKSHAQVTQMVTWAKETGFNALIVQVRKRGDTLYNSSVEPKVKDVASDYDPMADVISQAHAAGLQVHAWLSIYEVSQESKWYKPGPTHVCTTHPEWLMLNKEGNTGFDEGKVYLDPGVPAVQDHIASIVDEIVNRYEVDGIHLDNVRYPGRHGGYNTTSVERFNRQFGRGGRPNDDDSAWCQWRCDQVTGLVQRIHTEVRTAKPNVKVSAAVMMLDDPADAKTAFLQNWDTWARTGSVDILIPMLFLREDKMAEKAPIALRASAGRPMYIGIAGWLLQPQLALKQIEDARQAGAQGVVLFSYGYLGPNSKDAKCIKGPDLAPAFPAQSTP